MDNPTTIVLGAGVAGLSTALYLQRSGHQITVIDPLPPAGGVTPSTPVNSSTRSSYRSSGVMLPAWHARLAAQLTSVA